MALFPYCFFKGDFMSKKKKVRHPRSNGTWEKRKQELEKLKPTHPSNNGWWFFEYFKEYLHGNNS